MSDYILTQREYRNAKARLSRVLNKAKKTGDWLPVLEEGQHAAQLFRSRGYPDTWTRWSCAYDEACYWIRTASYPDAGWHLPPNPFH